MTYGFLGSELNVNVKCSRRSSRKKGYTSLHTLHTPPQKPCSINRNPLSKRHLQHQPDRPDPHRRRPQSLHPPYTSLHPPGSRRGEGGEEGRQGADPVQPLSLELAAPSPRSQLAPPSRLPASLHSSSLPAFHSSIPPPFHPSPLFPPLPTGSETFFRTFHEKRPFSQSTLRPVTDHRRQAAHPPRLPRPNSLWACPRDPERSPLSPTQPHPVAPTPQPGLCLTRAEPLHKVGRLRTRPDPKPFSGPFMKNALSRRPPSPRPRPQRGAPLLTRDA